MCGIPLMEAAEVNSEVKSRYMCVRAGPWEGRATEAASPIENLIVS